MLQILEDGSTNDVVPAREARIRHTLNQQLTRLSRHYGSALAAEWMKVAASQTPKALDHFTSTIIPCRTLQAARVLTIKHAAVLVGFAVAMMALVRQCLAD